MLRHAVRIQAPPAVVYGLIADATKRPRWLPELDSTDAPARLLVAGDRFTGWSTLLGHRFVGLSEVVRAAPGAELEEHVVIGARFTTRWSLTQMDDGGTTEVAHEIDVEYPRGPFGLVERWLLARRLARIQRAALRRLATLVALGGGA